MTNKEIAKELYRNSSMISPGETYHFSQLKLVTKGTRGPNLERGAPAGEVQVRNTFHDDAIIESITPGNYESENALYSFLCKLENYNPESLRDWLDSDK